MSEEKQANAEAAPGITYAELEAAHKEFISGGPSFDELVQSVMRHEDALRGMALYLNELRSHVENLYEALNLLDPEEPNGPQS